MKIDTLLAPIINAHLKDSDLEKQYLALSDKVQINDYIKSEDSFLQYAINVTIPNNQKGIFIPFFHIFLSDEKQSMTAIERMRQVKKEKKRYTFVNIVEDLKCDRIELKTDNKGYSKIVYPISLSEDDRVSVEKKLNSENGFAYSLWADECFYNKPQELFFEIISIESLEYTNSSTIVVVSTDKSKIKNFLEDKKWKILTVIDAIKSIYIRHQSEFVLQASLKSAKAAIMSRNMSHNLGSHVMFYIKQKLQSVSKIVDNKVLANIIPGKLSDLKTIEQKIKENKDVYVIALNASAEGFYEHIGFEKHCVIAISER